jgi:hypothetical protein
MAKMVPHCLRFDRQRTVFACFLTRCSAGINIAINNAMIAITTSSSINVNPFRLHMIGSSPFLLKKVSQKSADTKKHAYGCDCAVYTPLQRRQVP